ncbi:hypothetical protein [Catenuloplanes indicus]|uniref:Uncharacterized protein n=1 Tax=Catenuloplanes indicus TaxID=137267 RepID=A0AAE4B3B7_9ACTN|nr:hypothetical protein [Catenuloplanes indicus]MDQ0371596.1 hypothetical protein [Catenuloplanes indicus]MDQ0371609.1 hypothetical protein [Catenuloplanes indicus]
MTAQWLVTLDLAATYLAQSFGQDVTEERIRQWISRSKTPANPEGVPRRGSEGRRALYDLRDLITLAETRLTGTG